MWRAWIVAAPGGRDNETDPVLRERLSDLRAVRLQVRALATASLGAMAVTVLAGAHAAWLPALGACAATLVNDGQLAHAARARSEVQLERRLLAAALVLSAGAAVAAYAYGGWAGLLAIVLVLAAYGPALRPGAVLLLASVAALVSGSGVLLRAAGVDAVGPVDFGGPPVPAATLVTLAVAGIAYPWAQRLREARARARALAGELEAAGSEMAALNRGLEDWNRELRSEVRRQTEELEAQGRRAAVVNSVSRALSEAVGDDASFDGPLAVLGELLDACSVYVYRDAPEGGKATVRRVPGHGEHSGAEVPAQAFAEVAGGSRPLAVGSCTFTDEDGRELRCEYGAVPLAAKGRLVGALGVCRHEPWEHRDEDLEVLAAVGRELAVAIEHRREFRAALARASREALLNKVARILDETVETRPALEQALREVTTWMGAAHAGVVVRADESLTVQLMVRDEECRLTPEGDGDDGAVDRLILSLPSTVAGRPDALLAGPLGETAISLDVAALGVGSLLVAPVHIHRLQAGAVVFLGDAGRRWGSAQREVATRLAQQLAARLEADALVRLQARRISELSGLARVAEVVQSSMDPERLFPGFARAMAELLPFRGLYLARLGEGGTCAAGRYDSDGRREALKAGPADASHAWFGLRTAMQMDVTDGPPPAFYAGTEPPLVVPLRPKGQVLGVVAIEGGEVLPEQLPLVSQAVAQLALALDGAALYRQATERAARIQVLGNLARIVASVVDLRDAFEAFAEEVRWLIPFDRAVMLKIDPRSGTVEPYAACPVEDFASMEMPRFKCTLACAAYASERPVVLQRGDARVPCADWSVFGDADEVAFVPILRGDGCTAVFALAHQGGEPYSQHEVDALQEVGRLLAVSIERVELFQQAEHSARHDALTGLPNARYFWERLEAAFAEHTATSTLAVLMLDLDDLKVFNDTMGHSAGDRVITLVGEAVRSACRPADFVARVGGDEFVVLLEDAGRTAAEEVAHCIHEQLRAARLDLPGAPAELRVSIGIACAPGDGTSPDELLHAADVAMYSAKFMGGGRTALTDAPRAAAGRQAERGRPERLVDSVVRAATAAATPREREGIARAQRYAVGAALRVGVPVHESEVIRMLVARAAAERLADGRAGLDQTLAFTVLDGVSRDWASRAPESAALGQVVVQSAVGLAWLQLPEPYGAGCSTSEALGRLSEGSRSVLEAAVLQELTATVQADEGQEVRPRAA